MMEPLKIRRIHLDKAKAVQQFIRDVDDERIWIEERMPQATSTDYGDSLLSVQMLQKKNRSLRSDLDGHYPHFDDVINMGRQLVEEGHPQSEKFQADIDDLLQKWDDLTLAAENRKVRLEQSEVAQQVSN
jgi:spectrin beta